MEKDAEQNQLEFIYELDLNEQSPIHQVELEFGFHEEFGSGKDAESLPIPFKMSLSILVRNLFNFEF